MTKMSKITSQKQIEKQFLAEMGTELSDTHSMEDLKLSESVSKAVNENLPITKNKKSKNNDSKKNTSIFAGITDQIYGILGSKTAKEIILPSITIQKKRVRRSLEKEKSKLISQARKIKNSRKFNANALERTIAQIRHLQEMIDELFSFAAKKITELYKKYYLKVG
jgi:hypothetical protein